MTEKLARRWMNQNKWRIAKWNTGFLQEGSTQFSKQYFVCKRALNEILFRKFN